MEHQGRECAPTNRLDSDSDGFIVLFTVSDDVSVSMFGIDITHIVLSMLLRINCCNKLDILYLHQS